MTPDDVVDAYYAQLAARRPNVREPKKRTGSLKTAQQFIAWATTNELEHPLLYVKWRVDSAHAARFQLKLTQLIDERARAKWVEYQSSRFRVMRSTEKLMSTVKTPEVQAILDLQRAPSPQQEAYRLRHNQMQQTAACMATPNYSGGYDPRSKICPNCPQCVGCSGKLYQDNGFDVAAFRLGRIDVLPARIRAVI